MRNDTQRHGTILLATTMMLASCVSDALADWPTDPATPLVVGPAQLAFTPRLSVVTADDGAVWIAWQDSFCGGADEGSVRLQRVALDAALLAPHGIDAQQDPTCGFVLPPILTPVDDGVLVSRPLVGLDTEPLQSFDATGAAAWPAGFSTSEVYTLGASARLDGGDTLVVSYAWSTIRADRLDASGAPVWPAPSTFDSDTGPNLRILGIVPEPTGGAYVFWDSPAFAYTRLIRAQRLDADGTPAWTPSVRLVASPPDVTSSRHTDPVIATDGQGGAVVIFAQGFETGTTPAPLLMQRIDPDGALAFPLDGQRVSLGVDRQFDPIVRTDPATSDLLIVWRDGLFDAQSVRAQRMTPDGERLWGNQGIAVAPITPSDTFDAVWQNGRLSVVVASASGAVMHNFDAQGAPAPGPWTVSTDPAYYVRAVPSADGIVVAWQRDGEGLDDAIVAQRVNPDGRLGAPACSAADLSAPFGAIDFSDVVAFLVAFAGGEPAADLAPPLGQLDFSDVVAFLTVFAGGCP
ncbi:MAG: GC-type dockerin domain-anchored protein [Phycisphaerales bacterium]